MIINHTHRFIFVHIPKTAGSAVSVALSRLSGWNDIEVGVTPLGEAIQPHFLRRFAMGKHSTAAEIEAVVGPDIWRTYRKFALARDPIARTISTFQFLKRWRDWNGSDAMNALNSIDDFVLSPLWGSNGPAGILRPQADYTFASTGPIDYVGHSEQSDVSMEVIGRMIGHTFEPLPVVNESSALERPVPSPRAIDAIVKRYRNDFYHFGYGVPEAAL